jgi:MFS transporter, NNP family, nitrate/nitrite transporter
MDDRRRAILVLTANTIAFTVCFAVWMMNGVLATFLAGTGVMELSRGQIGWLLGAPVLTGALLRLPAGMLTDRYGGRPVFTVVLLIAAAATYSVSFANSFWGLLLASLGFGVAGASFAIGVGYSSVWFPQKWQGTALGIFGAGNAGAAFTALVGPTLLDRLTAGGAALEGWRNFPRLYAGALLVTALLFWLVTVNRRPQEPVVRSFGERLAPLREVRVWRFGLYYVLVFGGYVALAQWLLPYYVGVYSMTLATAGVISLFFTLPGGVIRALGGYLSDLFGARTIMYWVLGGTTVCCLLLIVPRMDITMPGEPVLATVPGTVTAVEEGFILVGDVEHELRPPPLDDEELAEGGIWPVSRMWHEPVVTVGDDVQEQAPLAQGVTHYYFDADIRVFTFLIMLIGILTGIGKAAVYKYIPQYFPRDVGTVGGLVGVLGGVGGFVLATAFGSALQWTGIWTTAWMILFILSGACLLWLHLTVRRMTKRHAPSVFRDIEDPGPPQAITLETRCPRRGIPAVLRLEPPSPEEVARARNEGRTASSRITACSVWQEEGAPPEGGDESACRCVELLSIEGRDRRKRGSDVEVTTTTWERE